MHTATCEVGTEKKVMKRKQTICDTCEHNKEDSEGDEEELLNDSQNVILINMKDMFNSMKNEFKQEIHDVKANIDTRLCSLESTITEKVKNAMRDEMSAACQYVDTEVTRLDNRLDRINASIDVTHERQKNLVIKYLLHDENEILEDNFKDLLSEGMGVSDVEVDKIVRKPSVQEDISGVVIMISMSKEDKDKVWKSKSKLEKQYGLCKCIC